VPFTGHNIDWHRHHMSLNTIMVEAYLANSDSWEYSPALKRYRGIPKHWYEVGEAYGRNACSALSSKGTPAVICVEKPYLDGFIDGAVTTIAVPFVLLAVNGGDAPVTASVQDRIVALPGFRACFAMNLHAHTRESFHPLPVGFCRPHNESAMRQCKASALPWEHRDRRLLVPPMKDNNRLRKRYIEVLSGPEYSDLVHIVKAKVPVESFYTLLSEHQSILSPPGQGYDCTRTWQAIGVGSVPLVVDDPTFDQRLHTETGAVHIPLPDQLSPECLKQLLSTLRDPAAYADKIEVGHWKAMWQSHLA